jgi:AbrB family looped-hinge helix DNA binding protein
MEQVVVSSTGQIEIPKEMLAALNLREGSKLNIEMRDRQIVLSERGDWRKLEGAGAHITKSATDFKREERELEDSRT